MDMTTPSGQLSGLSFVVLWVLLAILLFCGARSGLNAGPRDDVRSRTGDRSGGRIARYLVNNDRELGAAGLAVEDRARSYFARRIGKIHLAALAFIAVTTLVSMIWNRHETKMQPAPQIQVPAPSLHEK
ncbi:hypothetical protein [Rhizobium bangladeshense]|uniref:hypothetical protein n=1 Tax=Rhizobium bangladeshense TaxID=1138189 RepID=UPI0007E5B84F|nr:hypothetical protein [Rhizobium bangladeshense]